MAVMNDFTGRAFLVIAILVLCGTVAAVVDICRCGPMGEFAENVSHGLSISGDSPASAGMHEMRATATDEEATDEEVPSADERVDEIQDAQYEIQDDLAAMEEIMMSDDAM